MAENIILPKSKAHITKTVFAVIIPIAGFLFWFSFSFALNQGPGLQTYVGLALGALVLWSVFLAFGALFLDWLLWFGVVFLSLVPALVLLSFNLWTLVAIFVFSVLLLLVYARIRHEAASRISFHIVSILRKGIPLFLTILALLISITLFPTIQKADVSKVMSAVLEPSFKIVNPLLNNFLDVPELSPNSKVNDIIFDILSKESDIPIDQLSQDQLSFLIDTTREELSESVGLDLHGNDSILDILLNLSAPILPAFPFIFAAGFFLSLRFLFIFIGWISLFVFWLLTRIGIASGLMIFEKEQVEKGKLSLV